MPPPNIQVAHNFDEVENALRAAPALAAPQPPAARKPSPKWKWADKTHARLSVGNVTMTIAKSPRSWKWTFRCAKFSAGMIGRGWAPEAEDAQLACEDAALALAQAIADAVKGADQ